MTTTTFLRRWPALAAALWLSATLAAEPAPIEITPAQVQSLGIATQVAQPGAGGALATHPGRVVVPPAQQRVVAAPLAALVTAVHVAAGDTVRAGQVLAVLRSTEAQALQREALQADSQARLAQQSLQRDEQLHAEGLIAASRLEASRATHRQAQMLSQERRQAVQMAGGAGSGGEIVLRSPIAGTVLELSATPGQRVEGAVPLLRVATLSPLWLEVQVPAAQADALRVGDTLRVAGREATGRVLRLGAAADPATQAVTVRAELAPNARLRAGEVVEVQLAREGGAASQSGAVQLPAAALVRQGGGVAVFVQRAPGRYALQPVTPLSATGGQALVAGLAPGTAVVVQGTAALLALSRP
ncbi:efflux RND transporter periplasmic adaptor subunit [Azohydromonas lata]|uniref:Efflux RND transporter periplasmic adaptor subunit n=1 Tax=Azohydromonas lata TaxID=45677 RepID=A0ABU5ID67_9BURK|nr:efflux RND transporter periplasmic adaptor subunit [Azohydromonas lata]MDZ5457062.1 efflux RND transporter periplasmic adaptor subunit [Azohydromonas lata]